MIIASGHGTVSMDVAIATHRPELREVERRECAWCIEEEGTAQTWPWRIEEEGNVRTLVYVSYGGCCPRHAAKLDEDRRALRARQRIEVAS